MPTAGWLVLAWAGPLPVGLDRAGLLLDDPPEACIPCVNLVHAWCCQMISLCRTGLELSACTAVWLSSDVMTAITKINDEVAVACACCTLDHCCAQGYASNCVVIVCIQAERAGTSRVVVQSTLCNSTAARLLSSIVPSWGRAACLR